MFVEQRTREVSLAPEGCECRCLERAPCAAPARRHMTAQSLNCAAPLGVVLTPRGAPATRAHGSAEPLPLPTSCLELDLDRRGAPEDTPDALAAGLSRPAEPRAGVQTRRLVLRRSRRRQGEGTLTPTRRPGRAAAPTLSSFLVTCTLLLLGIPPSSATAHDHIRRASSHWLAAAAGDALSIA
jgi:hypothetical protein